MFAASPFSAAPFAATGESIASVIISATGVYATGEVGDVEVTADANTYPAWPGWAAQTWTNVAFESPTGTAPFLYWFNAYVGSPATLSYQPTYTSSSVVTGSDYIGSIPPSPVIGDHVYYHLRSRITNLVIATYDLGIVTGYPYDYAYTSRYSSVATTIPNVPLPANSGGAFPVSIGTLSTKAVLSDIADNTFYLDIPGQSAANWNGWVLGTVSVGDAIVVTAGGLIRDYGVVTGKPAITGFSLETQYGLTVSNPYGYATVFDSTATFSNPNSGCMTGYTGEALVVGQANIDALGISATGYLGTAYVSVNINIDVDGVLATGYVSDVSAVISANVFPAGVYGTGLIGSALVWGLVDDIQVANWQNINDTQSSPWTVVGDTQTADWHDVAT